MVVFVCMFVWGFLGLFFLVLFFNWVDGIFVKEFHCYFLPSDRKLNGSLATTSSPTHPLLSKENKCQNLDT